MLGHINVMRPSKYKKENDCKVELCLINGCTLVVLFTEGYQMIYYLPQLNRLVPLHLVLLCPECISERPAMNEINHNHNPKSNHNQQKRKQNECQWSCRIWGGGGGVRGRGGGPT